MDWVFIGITAITALLALGNWRIALYACVVLDAVRDPVRKMSAEQSSITTVIVGVVWFAALIGASRQNQREVTMVFRRYPQLKTSLITLVMALIPGALVSIVYYNNGWMLAVIGGASYSAPFVGVILGYLWPRRIVDVYRWIAFYTILNSAFLIGGVLEFYEFNVPGLGGMNMTWVRNYGHDFIKLMSGFYRSPDILGLHAAHVIMFAILIAIRPRQRFVGFWLAVIGWAAIVLILCGRRKMIVIPLIFVANYIAMIGFYTRRIRIAVLFWGFVGLCVAGLYIVTDDGASDNQYTRFTSSIASEGVSRASRSFTETMFTTMRQSGILGDGLGCVTQGRQYLGVVTNGKDWQEDGVGRLFKELGVPGVILILASATMLVKAMGTSIHLVPIGHAVSSLQFGFCGIVVSNLASFSVSHQAYSGDPSTVLIVGFCVGIILGLPRPVMEEKIRFDQREFENSHPTAADCA